MNHEHSLYLPLRKTPEDTFRNTGKRPTQGRGVEYKTKSEIRAFCPPRTRTYVLTYISLYLHLSFSLSLSSSSSSPWVIHSRDPSLYLPQNPSPKNQDSDGDCDDGWGFLERLTLERTESLSHLRMFVAERLHHLQGKRVLVQGLRAQSSELSSAQAGTDKVSGQQGTRPGVVRDAARANSRLSPSYKY